MQRHSLENINIPLERSLPFVSWIRYAPVAWYACGRIPRGRATLACRLEQQLGNKHLMPLGDTQSEVNLCQTN